MRFRYCHILAPSDSDIAVRSWLLPLDGSLNISGAFCRSLVYSSKIVDLVTTCNRFFAFTYIVEYGSYLSSRDALVKALQKMIVNP